MSDSPHWFDQLAIRLTRRESLKAALAGAAAVTLPTFRVPVARASGTEACNKGCNWTAHQQSSATSRGCREHAVGVYFGRVALAGWALPIAFVAKYQAAVTVIGCEDQAVLELKAASSACLQPKCGEFNPTQKGGPCAGCNASDYCCTNQSVAMGYECCSECCSPSGNGCGSGVTECGG